MARINLLPWREEYRQEKKKEFITQIVGVALASVAVSYLWISSVDGKITNQNARNNILDSEIKMLSEQVAEIEKLKQEKKELLDRMQVIQDLEGKRSIIVHYFDEFAKAVPDGIYIKSMTRTGEVITITGISESNARISAFMRKLNSSEWFADPNLKSVIASPEEGEQSGEFTMELITTLPTNEAEADG